MVCVKDMRLSMKGNPKFITGWKALVYGLYWWCDRCYSPILTASILLTKMIQKIMSSKKLFSNRKEITHWRHCVHMSVRPKGMYSLSVLSALFSVICLLAVWLIAEDTLQLMDISFTIEAKDCSSVQCNAIHHFFKHWTIDSFPYETESHSLPIMSSDISLHWNHFWFYFALKTSEIIIWFLKTGVVFPLWPKGMWPSPDWNTRQIWAETHMKSVFSFWWSLPAKRY